MQKTSRTKVAQLYHARKLKKLSLEEVASELGVDQSTVHRWETYVSAPRREHAPAVAAFIGCPLGVLLQEYAENVQRRVKGAGR